MSVSDIANVASIAGFVVAVVALWGNIVAMWNNFRWFRKGGVRITFQSEAYIIKKGGLDGAVIYKSSDRKDDYKMYRSMDKLEHYERIPPLREWNLAHIADDIRMPLYPLNILNKQCKSSELS